MLRVCYFLYRCSVFFGIYILKSGENIQIITENFVGVLPSGVLIQTFWIFIGLTVFVTFVDWLCNLFRLDDKIDGKGE